MQVCDLAADIIGYCQEFAGRDDQFRRDRVRILRRGLDFAHVAPRLGDRGDHARTGALLMARQHLDRVRLLSDSLCQLLFLPPPLPLIFVLLVVFTFLPFYLSPPPFLFSLSFLLSSFFYFFFLSF